MFERRIWEEVSRFQSHDYVGTWYSRRHNRNLSSARRHEIASCFSQGREYYMSANGAAISVKPLLLYYGVLALSRGLILLLDRTKNEANLRPSHGLEVVDWQQTLAHGISNILDVKVRATNGTFSELVTSAENTQPSSWWSGPTLTLGEYRAHFRRPNFLTDGSQLSLDDLLSRDIRFMTLYTDTIGKHCKVHLCEVFAGDSRVEVSIFPSYVDGIETAIRENFSWPQRATIGSRATSRRLPISNIYVHIDTTDLVATQSELPFTHYLGNDGMFIVEDFPNGDKMSDLYRTFMISYYLGMIVRYFPSKWISLLRNEKGDIAQPLIAAAVNGVEKDFPRLIVDALW